MKIRLLLITIWVTLVVTASYFLFHVSFEVETLDGQIKTLNRNITLEQENIKNLEIEWAYLTSPNRIAALAKNLLPQFAPVPPSHIITLDTIPDA